jgi:HPt (histidine-containing phosphotransfer) domain-containing protein
VTAAFDGSGQPPVLDAEQVAELHEIDPEGTLVADMVKQFLAEAPTRIDLLRAAVDSRDVEEAQRVAHGLRGGSASLGASRLGRVCADIERAAASGDTDEIVRSAGGLHDELNAFSVAIRSALPSLASPPLRT